ncbi:hypothetical protein BOV_1567 [Brucella ovis ATCC 25840]|uniref:Uncharacterized protein n=1 Tax=Brucella ovis (strain ATCC 25840 / 63/290 / NCTC 10512) TaxID=444178 RepID=A0A0H3AP51_BRUO2|nr:hypothetical protein BOV_1567 [Brucella ovis ATCC 25840]
MHLKLEGKLSSIFLTERPYLVAEMGKLQKRFPR